MGDILLCIIPESRPSPSITPPLKRTRGISNLTLIEKKRINRCDVISTESRSRIECYMILNLEDLLALKKLEYGIRDSVTLKTLKTLPVIVSQTSCMNSETLATVFTENDCITSYSLPTPLFPEIGVPDMASPIVNIDQFLLVF
ncbi:hypothetical protein QTP88_018193 [Uroleucon formosanum]